MALTMDPRIKARETGRYGTVYDVRVRINGEQRQRTFPTKTQASDWLTETDENRRRGTSIDPRNQKITVEELGKSWLASNPGKRVNTRATDEVALNGHIVPALGTRRIGGVTPPDVQKLVNIWEKSVRARTVRRYYGVLRAMFEYAARNDWIGRTPCRGINLPKLTPSKTYLLTPDAVESIALAMPKEYRPMVLIGAVLGLRWEEIAALRVGSFTTHGKDSSVTITETVIRDQKGHSMLSTPKSDASARTLAVPRSLMTLIRQHMKRQGLVGPDELLFADSNGGLLRYSNWRNRIWVPACEKAGHPLARSHGLRRAHATSLVVNGVDARTAKDRLGHSDVRMTLELYAQSVPEADRRAGEASGAYFMPGRKRVSNKRAVKRPAPIKRSPKKAS